MRLVLAAAFSLLATAASAQVWTPGNQYVAISGASVGEGEFSVDYDQNVARDELELDSGTGVQLAFGSRAQNWRVEGAFSQRTQDITAFTHVPPGGPVGVTRRTQVEVRALDLNGYFDVPTGTMLRPYVGAGFGLAQVDLGNLMEAPDSTLHLQAIGGVSADLSPRVALFAEARFERVGDLGVTTEIELETAPNVFTTFSGEDEFGFTNTQLAAGVRIGF